MRPGKDDVPQLYRRMCGQTWCAYQPSSRMCIHRSCLAQSNDWTSTSTLSHRIARSATSCLGMRRKGLAEGALQCRYGHCTR
jgi:hypothetical protein